MAESARRYERIDIELPCRLFIKEAGKQSTGLRFEAFTRSKNLGLGGIFVESGFLLSKNLELHVEITLPDGKLPIRGRIAHRIEEGDADFPTGMGIEFLDVDGHGRETLLRYFTPERYQEFYASLVKEFPHLKGDVELRDISLILNLWEESKVRAEGGPLLTASGAPMPPKRRLRK